jgi:hypothetical protein
MSDERSTVMATRLLELLAPPSTHTDDLREHVRAFVESYVAQSSSAVWRDERQRTRRLVRMTALLASTVCTVVLELLHYWGAL